MKSNRSCLIQIKTAEGDRSHLIDKPSFTLGRTQEADLPIVDVSVSRVHLSIVIKDEHVWICDQKSANGTIMNGTRLKPGESVAVNGDDVIKLGTLGDEFRFLSIPKPFEVLDLDTQKNALMASMDGIAREIEMKARQKVEREYRQAQLEVEQLLAKAHKDAETLKTRELYDLQSRKQALEGEVLQLKQKAQLASSEELALARKEADRLMANAQRQIQKDFEEVTQRTETQLSEAQSRSLKMIEDAESRSHFMVNEARKEAAQLRLAATTESRHQQQEALKKSAETIAQLQERMQREIAGKKEDLANQLKLDGEKERERIRKENTALKDTLQSQVQPLEESCKSLRTQAESLTRETAQLNSEFELVKTELASAKKFLSSVESLEKRREVAEKELNEFTQRRDSGLSSLERELKELRDKGTVEISQARKAQENELAQQRVKALEEVQFVIQTETQKFEKSKKLMALDLGQRLFDQIVPRLTNLISNQTTSPAQVAQEVRAALDESVYSTLVGDMSSIRMGTKAGPTFAERDEKKKKITKGAVFAGAAVVVVGVFYSQSIWRFLESIQPDGAARNIIEQRRIQSIYAPRQDNTFRNNYTDNVLYMKGYFETKSDSSYIEKWTLHLNNIGFLRPMGLSEEDVVHFIAKETNLVQRLGAMRTSIDALFLQEGIDRLRAAEVEDVAEIKALLKGDANYAKFKVAEEEFLHEYMRSHSSK